MKSKVIMKENLLITLCLILLSYGMTGCKDSTRTLLSKSVEMEKISTDSMLFYLQQIQEPNHLTNKQRAEYCFQLYKATLWKTQKPKDSLLKVCIPLFLQYGDTAQWLQAQLEQANSYFYKHQPDSVLHVASSLQNKKKYMTYSQQRYYYNMQKFAYFNLKKYSQALDLANSVLTLNNPSNDTLSLFYDHRSRLEILKKMGKTDEAIEGYYKMLEWLAPSKEYRYLNYSIAEDIVNYHLQQQDFNKALESMLELRSYRRNRYDVPYYQLIRGQIFQSLHQLDSAQYYYKQAAISTSPYIAAEATSRLFRLINATQYPEQAYYLAKNEDILYDNLTLNVKTEETTRKYNEAKLQNELYQLRLTQQEKELWMMGITVILLFIALLISFFYHQEKKKRLLSERKLQAEQAEEEARRLQHENELLHKEAELSALREKEIFMRNKESEMRESLFRHISFFQKLPSLHTENSPEDGPNSRKITVNDAEWSEVKQAVNDAFNNFVDRLQENYPQLSEKDICFCCLVKINVNIQDLSDIYCVSKAAITKRKYRIKTEKMHISDETLSLDAILQSF